MQLTEWEKSSGKEQKFKWLDCCIWGLMGPRRLQGCTSVTVEEKWITFFKLICNFGGAKLDRRLAVRVMCSPGVTFQSMYLLYWSAEDFHWRSSEEEPDNFRFACVTFLKFFVHLCFIWSRQTIISLLRHEGVSAHLCLCPPGSVTGICPCRVKERRAWPVTAPGGQTSLQKGHINFMNIFINSIHCLNCVTFAADLQSVYINASTNSWSKRSFLAWLLFPPHGKLC